MKGGVLLATGSSGTCVFRPNIPCRGDSDKVTKDKISKIVYGKKAERHFNKEKDIAKIVKSEVGKNVKIVQSSTNDLRSYHISSKKITDVLEFVPKNSVADAVNGLIWAFQKGLVSQPMKNSKYFNVKTFQDVKLSKSFNGAVV